jgi:hypothetical protein
MIDLHQTKADYSAPVLLQLSVAGQTYPLAKTGPDYVVLRTPANIPASVGEIRIVVGGRERIYPVRISDTVPFDECVRVSPVDT